jgi:hypothetical protein
MTATALPFTRPPDHFPVPPEVALAFWYELRGPREALHRRYGLPCDTELRLGGLRLGRGTSAHVAPQGPSWYRLSGHCPCRDLVADAFAVVVEFLTDRSRTLRNPAGAIRTHLRFRLADLTRSARKDRGAQVKPDTVENNRYGRALPDDFHRAVLVMLVDEAGCHGPLRCQEGLLRRLADRCATRFGGEPDNHRHQLAAALPVIEQVCRSGPKVNVGTTAEPEMVTWWDAYIDQPLGRRENPADVAVEDRHTDVAAPELCADTDDVVLTELVAAVEAADGDEHGALVAAVVSLREGGLIPHLRARLLLTDSRHRELVLDHIHALRTDATPPRLKYLRHPDR